jgi:hypothetical protein
MPGGHTVPRHDEAVEVALELHGCEAKAGAREREKRKAAELLVRAERSSGERRLKGSRPFQPLTLLIRGGVGNVMVEMETSVEAGPWSTAASNVAAALLWRPLRERGAG